jgi:quinol-cytochrome oxidoreductase complex cytochrome b subunit
MSRFTNENSGQFGGGARRYSGDHSRQIARVFGALDYLVVVCAVIVGVALTVHFVPSVGVTFSQAVAHVRELLNYRQHLNNLFSQLGNQ